jgi:DNA-binding GntR family transcriptional regulator
MTVKQRIEQELRQDDGLDDDELTIRLGLSRRQTVNQAARALQRDGRLVRYKDSGYKIVNMLVPRGRS